jgi:hypothetical protein
MSLRSNVAACAKHFVGDGGTTKGIDENNTVINYKGLINIHMTPYFDAIAKGVSTIMVSYSSWNGMKMHANRFLISHVLKKQLGFKVLLLCIFIIVIGLGFVFNLSKNLCYVRHSTYFTMMPSFIGHRASLFQIGKVSTE